MDETKQNQLHEQMKEKLQKELEKYQEEKQQFTDYLKDMQVIDTWLQDGVKNENC